MEGIQAAPFKATYVQLNQRLLSPYFRCSLQDMNLVARIREDINSVLERDQRAFPLEVLLCYPGLWRVDLPHLALALGLKLRLPARVLSQIGRFYTAWIFTPARCWADGCLSITRPAW